MSISQVVPVLSPGAEVQSLLDAWQVRRYQAIPLRREGRALVVAMANPRDLAAVEELEFITGSRLCPAGFSQQEIERAIERHYPLSLLPVPATQATRTDIDDSPIVELQRALFREAIRLGASDIHLDPGERSSRVSYRVDGHMVEAFRIPGWLHSRLIARIKVIARLDISEHRYPQDGHLHDREDGFEARLSTLPTYRGEAVVLRLFGDRGALPTLDGIGCAPGIRDRLVAISNRPQGVLVVTGPTGSGKTTTLYAILNMLRRRPVNIVTIEDPVEYRVDGIRQVQIDERASLTFQTALRATLRQDPDVILVGEIRDPETARIAFHAGMTGHLVLTTVHATEAVGTLVRLAELGVDRGVIASTLIGVVAQRLVRHNCRHCIRPDEPPDYCLERMGISADDRPKLMTSPGCAECRYSGTGGRRPLFEILEPNDSIRSHVVGRRDARLRQAAVESGCVPLYRSVRERVVSGDVALEEAYRTCYFGDPK